MEGFDPRAMAAMGKERFFKKGNLQFVILKMLQQDSKHGYQIIKDLEEQFKGFYSPSPGSVYPILQMLEDREFVSISKEGKKKVYTITDEGQAFLNENMDDTMLNRMEHLKHMDFDKMQASREQLQDLFRTFMMKSKASFNDEDKKRKFNEFVERTKKELEDLY
ncbi:PadR family transcriptional regulator [Staphylococcus sp. ACRSN]|uniref:PadR family transcriptional regulator n=1 Tax=Staphylococcus sp. ACRSN TaxID=2918214 RepID=UPI001EF2CD75|nr:PadR family transcriptional regulator [Staphylococcus sp. ACRSN]MCG7339165.1 PadR family transcriptional regulator [Staphylococcus sp. ACRSN]